MELSRLLKKYKLHSSGIKIILDHESGDEARAELQAMLSDTICTIGSPAATTIWTVGATQHPLYTVPSSEDDDAYMELVDSRPVQYILIEGERIPVYFIGKDFYFKPINRFLFR